MGAIVNDVIDSFWCLVLYITFNQCETEYGIYFPFVTDALKLSLSIPVGLHFKREFQRALGGIIFLNCFFNFQVFFLTSGIFHDYSDLPVK